MPKGNRQLKGTVLVLLSAIGYGTEAIFVKYIFATGLTPVATTVWRFLLAGVVMIPVLFLNLRQVKLSTRQHLAMLLVGGVFNVGVVYFLMTAINLGTASSAILCLYVYPVLVSLGSVPLLGERFSKEKTLGLFCSLSGVALVAWQPGSQVAPAGISFAFVAAILNAASILTVKRELGSLPSSISSSGVLVWGMISYLLIGGSALAVPPASWLVWLLLVGLVGLATIMPFFAIYAGLRLIDASQVGVISSAEPVVTAALAAIFLRERLTWLQLLGAVFIVGAVLIVQSQSTNSKVKEAAE